MADDEADADLEQRLTKLLEAVPTLAGGYDGLISHLGKVKDAYEDARRDAVLRERVTGYAGHLKEAIAFEDPPSSVDVQEFTRRKQEALLRLDVILGMDRPPVVYVPKKRTGKGKSADLHAEMKSEFFRRREGKVIIPVTPDCGIHSYEIRSDAGRFLASHFRSEVRAFRNIPYVGLSADYRDEQRIIAELHAKREHAEFSRYGICRRDAIPSSIVFLPERTYSGGIRHCQRERRLWNLENIGAYDANAVTEGEGAIVAVIDTGVDYLHDELYDRFDRNDPGWNFIDNNNEVMDKEGHGTHVSGTICGKNTGVAPMAILKAFVVLDEYGTGNAADSLFALDECIERGVDAVNFSLGSPDYSQAFQDLCLAAYQKGVMIAAAGGNDGMEDFYCYPGAYDGVMGVAAVGKYNEWLEFSNANDMIDIAAPGGDIYSSVPGGYAYLSGTSMATPHVTGCLALLRAARPGLTAEQYFGMLAGSGESLPYNSKKVGAGLVRIDKALLAGTARHKKDRAFTEVSHG